jgi:hypothetical protein
MSERGVIDVLHVEDDPGYALIVRKSFAQASRNSRFHARMAGRPCGSSAGLASTPARPSRADHP